MCHTGISLEVILYYISALKAFAIQFWIGMWMYSSEMRQEFVQFQRQNCEISFSSSLLSRVLPVFSCWQGTPFPGYSSQKVNRVSLHVLMTTTWLPALLQLGFTSNESIRKKQGKKRVIFPSPPPSLQVLTVLRNPLFLNIFRILR